MFSQKSNPEFQIFMNSVTNEIFLRKTKKPIQTRLGVTDLIGQKFVKIQDCFFVKTCGEQLKKNNLRTRIRAS